MKKMTKGLIVAAPVALALGLVAMPAAQASTDGTYDVKLVGLSGQHAHGTATITLKGQMATVVEDVTGLPAKFGKMAYPHVQHIHINGMGMCPTLKLDKNHDGVISTVEGTPAYGPIGASLTTKGDTSPAAGLTLAVAPTGGHFHYQRTFKVDKATAKAISHGKATIVVHGLDPAKVSKKASKEKSEIVPSLPLAATSPATCGRATM
jgi:hypothetical protein